MTTSSVQLIGLVGSLRAESMNRAVFDAAVELLPEGATLTEHSLADVPLYHGDVEAEGDPGAVVALKEVVEAADGIIFFTPEYNRSIPAVTKNAIDWLSRVVGDSALLRSATGVVAASPGGHDCAGVRGHMSDSLSGISGHFFETTHGIASVSRQLEDGRLTDSETRESLAAWLASYVAFVAENR